MNFSIYAGFCLQDVYGSSCIRFMNFSVYAGFCLQDVYGGSCIRFISFGVSMETCIFNPLNLEYLVYEFRRVYAKIGL